MKLSTNLKALTAAVVMALPAMAPTTANAELGYNASVSSMYLWRGQNVSGGAPAISGGIDYSHESGVYASTWVSSGEPTLGYEHDIWVGYAGEAGGVGYDISFWYIDYPEAAGDVINETALGLSYKDFSFGYVDGDGYSYTTLGYGIGPVSFTYGMNSADVAGSDFSHIGVSYAASDELSFTISKLTNDDATHSEEPLIVMTYSLPIGK